MMTPEQREQLRAYLDDWASLSDEKRNHYVQASASSLWDLRITTGIDSLLPESWSIFNTQQSETYPKNTIKKE